MPQSHAVNFFRTNLVAPAAQDATSVTVFDNGVFDQLTFPTYMVIHRDGNAKLREVVQITGSGVSGSNRTLTLGARGLAGSTVATGSPWPTGSRVVAPPLKQSLDDVYDSIVFRSLVDTKGDLIAASGNDTVQRLPVGANGTLLEANSGSAQGLRYRTFADVSANLLTVKGDLLVRNATTGGRQAVGADHQTLVADSAQANGVRWVSGGMHFISETTLGAAASQLSLASLPATYKMLKVHALLRADQAATIQSTSTIRLNANATAANYTYHNDQTSSTSATGVQGTALPVFGNYADTAPAGYFTLFEMEIPWYADTSITPIAKYTSRSPGYSTTVGFSVDGSFVFSGAGGTAINRVQLFPATGNWVAGSRMAIYGIS